VQRKIIFTSTADKHYAQLKDSPSRAAIVEQVRKAIGYPELNPHHPSLSTDEFTSLQGAHGEKVLEAYAQNNAPGAYRIFWHYGPDEFKGKKRTAVITVVAITPHP